ncbi:MAG TPA: hypothetical protein VF895_10195 [Gaiellaceae bacterium]
MGIVNKRNAVLGWAAWKVGKGMFRKKAKGVLPGKSQHSSKRKPAMFAGLIAAVGGAAWLKRKRKGGEQSEN